MPTNRYDNYIPTQWGQMKPFELPIDVIGKTLQTLQDRSDRNYAMSQELPSLLKTQSLDPDKAAVNMVQKGFQDQIDKMALDANGDYSGIGKQLLGLKSNIDKELRQGTLGAAQQEYTRFQKNQQDELERLKKKEIREEDYKLGINHALKSYKGIGQIDPMTGTWNHYGETYAPGFNENKAIEEAMKNLKPDELEQIGIVKRGDNYFEKTKTGHKYLTFEKAQNAIGGYVSSDPDFQRLQAWRAERGGNSLAPALTGMINARASGAAFDEYKIDKELTWDQNADLNQRERHHRDRMAMEAPESNMLPTNLNNFDIIGNGTVDFNKEFNTQNDAFNTKPNKGNLGNPFGLTMNLDNNKKIPFDENNPKYKGDPMYQNAIKLVNQNFKGSKDSPEYRTALSTFYNTLTNSQNYDRRAYQMSDDRSKALSKTAWDNRYNMQVQEVNADGTVSKRSQQLASLWESEDINKDINQGKVGMEGSSFPLSTGISGTVMNINGKRYISKQLSDPKIQPILDKEESLGRDLLKDGNTVKNVRLPYLKSGQQSFNITSRAEVSEDGRSANMILELKDSKTNEIIGNLPLSDLYQMSDGWHQIHNPYAKIQRPKDKSQQFQKGSNNLEID